MPKSLFQFSIAALLLTIAVAAGDLALMRRADSAYALLAQFGLMFVFLAFIAIALVYGRDNIRPFCIGAAFPLAMAFLNVGFALELCVIPIRQSLGHATGRLLLVKDPITANLIVGTALLASIALGLLCVVLRWLIEERDV